MSGGNDGGGGSWSSRFLKVASGLHDILSSASASSQQEVPFTESWKKPEIGWVKLNVDGSRDPYKSSSAGCGGVLRNHSATWLRGFAQKLNPTYQVHQTELQAILTGLKMASEMNVKKLIVESDSNSVVSMVENGVRPNHPDYNVVELIRTERRRFGWEVRFVSISNKANRVADRLANDARKLATDDVCEEYHDPPASVQSILKDESETECGTGSFMKVAGAAAAAVTVAGGLYALLSSAASASSDLQVPSGGPWSPHHETPSQQVRWKKPEIGWVKLNVDGSRDHEEPSAGCGGVIRDARGTWLMGFAKKLDPTFEPHETELQAILTGLELASEMNVEKLVVESDSEPAVSMVKSGLGFKDQRREYNVVQDIVRLLSDTKWQVRLDYVPRIANRVANRLANDARKLFSNNLRKYPFTPDNCAQLVLEDNN